jgi:hypothetical protein
MRDESNRTWNEEVERKAKIGASFVLAKGILLSIRHPIFVLKTEKQAEPSLSNSVIAKDLYNRRGIRGFYTGTFSSVMKVGVQELYRGPLMIDAPLAIKKADPSLSSFWASMYSVPLISIIDAGIICPITKVSAVQITKKDGDNSFIEAFKQHSTKQLYRGYMPLLAETAINWGAFFLTDETNKIIHSNYSQNSAYPLILANTMGISALTVALNLIPDTIRVQMQKAHSNNEGVFKTTKSFSKTYGGKGFFCTIPHKIYSSIVGYGYKAMLRNYWDKKGDQSKF